MPTRETLRFLIAHSPHPLSQFQAHNSLHLPARNDTQEFIPGARVTANLAPLDLRLLWGRPRPPCRLVCCHHVVWAGPDVRAGRGCAGAEKGAGDSACCVAARGPEAILLRPLPDDVVSFSRAAAAAAQQQQRRGRRPACAPASRPQQ